ncbi:MAG: HEPN domain-containing protein [Saprospiraceae bacterium]|nr:MAG: HEPN domain-containing protein [Saprospiraceae bacterium]
METGQVTIIDRQYENGISLVDYLKNQQQLTFYNEAENNFRKTILLLAASYFEKEISETVIDFAKSHSSNDDLVVSIIKQKAVSRQYHTYFGWDKANANSFFSLFGEDFKNRMIQKVKADNKLDESIKAFLEIGNERNKMVHQNFAEIIIDKTAEEIYKLYQTALYFIDTMKTELIKQTDAQD